MTRKFYKKEDAKKAFQDCKVYVEDLSKSIKLRSKLNDMDFDTQYIDNWTSYPYIYIGQNECGATHNMEEFYRHSFRHISVDDIINIELIDDKCYFKPFDQVLVRDEDDDEWRASLFSHMVYDEHRYCAGGIYWGQCIRYAGNEHLIGTSNSE